MVGSASLFVGGSPQDQNIVPPPGEMPLPGEPVEAVAAEGGPPREAAQTPVVEPEVALHDLESSPSEVVVSIRGAVARPGLLTLPADSRVQDLLNAAGGAEESADLSNINVAARLIDGKTLTVPQGVRISVSEEGASIERRSTAHVTNPPEYTIYGWRPERRRCSSHPPMASSTSTEPPRHSWKNSRVSDLNSPPPSSRTANIRPTGALRTSPP